MDSDEQQMLDHPAHGAYLVKSGCHFVVRCEQHRRTDTASDRRTWFMPDAIAKMQAHNERFH
jgi:hypothetical protein